MIERAPFGATGHESSRTIFGAAALGSVSKHDADRTLELLLQHGVNHIDVAASYGDAELRIASWLRRHEGEFFVATKTGERTYRGAREEIRRSLDRLGVDHVDSIQLHNLVDVIEWETALGADGALEAAIEAREEGLVRFIGVTGHGLSIPEMHRRSLERFAFDSVLCPYNFPQMQDPRYAETFEALAARLPGAQRGAADDQEPRVAALGRPRRDRRHVVRAAARAAGHRPRGALGPRAARRVPAHRRRRRAPPARARRRGALRAATRPTRRWRSSPAGATWPRCSSSAPDLTAQQILPRFAPTP